MDTMMKRSSVLLALLVGGVLCIWSHFSDVLPIALIFVGGLSGCLYAGKEAVKSGKAMDAGVPLPPNGKRLMNRKANS